MHIIVSAERYNANCTFFSYPSLSLRVPVCCGTPPTVIPLRLDPGMVFSVGWMKLP